MNVVVLPGPRALRAFQIARLADEFARLGVDAPGLSAHYVHFVAGEIGPATDRLDVLLSYGERAAPPECPRQLTVVPRPGTISPWSSRATDIALTCGLAGVKRIERGVRWFAEGPIPERVWPLLHDRMTEVVQRREAPEDLFVEGDPRPLVRIPLRAQGRATLVGERSHGKGSVQRLLRIPGVRDEPFEDQNRNGMHDEWEPYDDLNGNGRFDYAPIVKLTVAYYYLPDGSSIHTLRDHEGRIVHKGGVPPDVEAEFPELDYLTLRELERLFDAEAFRSYAKRILDQDPELAVRLAQFDEHDVSLYPGWDEFYAGLETPLDPQEVRRWVRRRLRDLVSDRRGKVFPGNGFYGDFEEDPQLQAAIRVLLDRAGVAVESIREYEDVFAHAPDATSSDAPADG